MIRNFGEPFDVTIPYGGEMPMPETEEELPVVDFQILQRGLGNRGLRAYGIETEDN